MLSVIYQIEELEFVLQFYWAQVPLLLNVKTVFSSVLWKV